MVLCKKTRYGRTRRESIGRVAALPAAPVTGTKAIASGVTNTEQPGGSPRNAHGVLPHHKERQAGPSMDHFHRTTITFATARPPTPFTLPPT